MWPGRVAPSSRNRIRRNRGIRSADSRDPSPRSCSARSPRCLICIADPIVSRRDTLANCPPGNSASAGTSGTAPAVPTMATTAACLQALPARPWRHPIAATAPWYGAVAGARARQDDAAIWTSGNSTFCPAGPAVPPFWGYSASPSAHGVASARSACLSRPLTGAHRPRHTAPPMKEGRFTQRPYGAAGNRGSDQHRLLRRTAWHVTTP